MKRVVERYGTQSMHYLDNAFGYLRKGDASKASEFLWGSIAEAVKAVAASRGITLYSHKRLKDYVYELSRELRDKELYDTFNKAQSLHGNFYECGLLLEDVQIAADDIKVAVGKLLSLIPQES